MSRLGPNLWDDPNFVLGSIIPKYKGFDLGSPELPFRNIYVENDISIGDDLNLTGDLVVDGTTTLIGAVGLTSSLFVNSFAVVNSGLTVSGLSTLTGGADLIGNLGVNGAVSLINPSDTITFTSLAAAADNIAGTVIANEATEVIVATTEASAEMVVEFGLAVVGGTPAGAPYLSSVTPGVSFGVKAGVGDTSTYNWLIKKINFTV